MESCRAKCGPQMAMRRLAAESETEGERTRWVKMELALVLGEATGRRLGAIRQLRWDDILWDTGVIRWRAEADKKRREWVVPMPAALCGELRQFRCKLGAVGGWVFAAERNPEAPMDRHLFDRWLTHAEREGTATEARRRPLAPVSTEMGD